MLPDLMTQQDFTPQSLLMMQHLYTSVLWVDASLTVQWANAQSETLFATSRTYIIGQSVLDILSPLGDVADDDKSCSSLANRFAHAGQFGQPFIDHNQHIKGIAQPVLLDYSVTPVVTNEVADDAKDNDSPTAIHFVVELWAKSRQSKLDKERQLQEQHDVARQMLRSVAHEVKNPLAGIRGAGQLLSKYTKKHAKIDHDGTNLVQLDGDKLMSYANIVISETDRLTRLIDDLLGSNHLPNWESLNIHEPLEHVLTLIEAQHNQVTVIRDYDLSLPELTADRNQLIQVFLNLANNACHAMLEGTAVSEPKLTVTTRIAWSHTIGTTRHNNVLKVSVHDNGKGIDPELIERIFFPLVTGRANGTGLGLSLVQDMVHRHGGAIEVTSQKGNTEFCVYLPFEQDN